jgi:hypothetical protein
VPASVFIIERKNMGAGSITSPADNPVSFSTTFDPELQDELQYISQVTGVEIPDMQTAQAPSSNDSCMSDFLSILKVVLPAVAPLM